jgi:hypothetical protein
LWGIPVVLWFSSFVWYLKYFLSFLDFSYTLPRLAIKGTVVSILQPPICFWRRCMVVFEFCLQSQILVFVSRFSWTSLLLAIRLPSSILVGFFC